ncbi:MULTISPECIES: ArsA family ATPase [unclassified Nostoc]|uniref:ArsA family ATPase n=1 Tax=unclassified Nostoc TaxID=2593658 RepID=UPI002AD32613|nr:ArsA family ATPase [Nostoc sp. DedQUE03]MDZ7976693.1 ArsA family ATPase [Nostoc sp. DedQUE03]MDZ8044332.1 ArsA family ATPase [Nostoc sp. DedQUE02]
MNSNPQIVDSIHQYDSLCLTMFSGKGGVGKTTLACAFARRVAQLFPNENILLISTDPAHSLGDVLEIEVAEQASPLSDLPNLSVQALDAKQLLLEFKAKYGNYLELLVERGSFVEGEDLTPVWDLEWPGIDEVMGLLEIQKLLTEKAVDRIVVDMAPSGHTLNLLGIKDFLDVVLNSLELFQEKHRAIAKTFSGRYIPDEVDDFLAKLKSELAEGKRLLQDVNFTACLVVAIAEPMSLLETKRFLDNLQELEITCGGLIINKILTDINQDLDRYSEQQKLLNNFLDVSANQSLFIVPQQITEPLGSLALDNLISQIKKVDTVTNVPSPTIQWPVKISPNFSDFINEGKQLILIGGKGGVGKTTVAAAIGWSLASYYPDKNIRLISIDPAHSLGDAFGKKLGHEPTQLTANLSGQEIDAKTILEQFRKDYLWELAEMMSGEGSEPGAIKIAYTPEAWRQLVAQALPGIDEMLSLITIMDLLDSKQQDLIILDTAPTGHLLRFLEMPSALAEWLAWIFKLWMKYQNALGRIDFMARLRKLRQQVMQAQKKLQDPNHTEFIGVIQAEAAILAEQTRLTESLAKMHVSQRYIVHNRYIQEIELDDSLFVNQTIIRLPILPRSVESQDRIIGAAKLLF